MNELLFFIAILVSYCMVLFLYRTQGVGALYVWVGFAMVLANIEAVKGVQMFGMTLSLGNVVYLTTDFVTTILNENHSKEAARRSIRYGFMMSVAFVVLSQITLAFKPIPEGQEIANAMHDIFILAPRTVAASLFTFILSGYVDTGVYDFLKNKVFKKDCAKNTFLRSEISSAFSQFVDSVVFTVLAFAGVPEVGGNSFLAIVELSLTTYAAKMIIGCVDTPFLFIAKRMYKNHKEEIDAKG